MANTFNKHFISIGPKLAENIETQICDDPLKYLPNERLPVETSLNFKELFLNSLKMRSIS